MTEKSKERREREKRQTKKGREEGKRGKVGTRKEGLIKGKIKGKMCQEQSPETFTLFALNSNILAPQVPKTWHVLQFATWHSLGSNDQL